MQQTNFTAYAFYTATIPSSNTWQNLGPSLALATLGLRSGDIFRVEAMVLMDNTSGGSRAFQLGVKQNGGTVVEINNFNADDSTTPLMMVTIDITIGPGDVVNEGHAMILSSGRDDVTLVAISTDLNDAVGVALTDFQFQVKSNNTGATFWIHSAVATRIRAGL